MRKFYWTKALSSLDILFISLFLLPGASGLCPCGRHQGSPLTCTSSKSTCVVSQSHTGYSIDRRWEHTSLSSQTSPSWDLLSSPHSLCDCLHLVFLVHAGFFLWKQLSFPQPPHLVFSFMFLWHFHLCASPLVSSVCLFVCFFLALVVLSSTSLLCLSSNLKRLDCIITLIKHNYM